VSSASIPPRPPEPIPRDERLFRAICAADVDVCEILPSAVDLQGTSVHRDAYLDSPDETFAYVPEGLTGLAVVTSSTLPQPLRNPNAMGRVREEEVTWEFFAVDDPFTDETGRVHAAHAEIRVRRVSDRPGEENVRPSSAVKRLLRKKLARRMKLFLAPRS